MAKLGSFNLNCALCDDMGLGKTLQSLTVVINESAKRKTKSVSLVVCPTSLTYNWLSEIKKFFSGV
jgi:SNF2 family DNA or RNA helicase